MGTVKKNIDNKIGNEAIRKLMYWKFGNDPECFEQLNYDYNAGSQEFADDVMELLSCIDIMIVAYNKIVKNKNISRISEISLENNLQDI